ncbi:hypothetical protein R2223_003502 [Cronobacter sakazakii]|uniref:hypothetical protein n=1 Tax=Cronobacter sakazakii TaxID=28141 RepID=UPI0012A913E8|nr:hypothetical protein [Cronobacter sakazakii]EKS1073467.1 hypothetical protein [Cronobacter sakazakii]EKS1087145.1 hypothetical protein [Cronobacter sakazakii]ELQ5973821.1 hypothetical protein [Cronobacter sakazakii]ELQ6034841.1 hypothetical protein [Cronobacter sakazakii]ELQ6043556.1 hypothetical protein [Cronobacter sakazakii]
MKDDQAGEWIHLYNLANMETELMVIAALKRINGSMQFRERGRVAVITLRYVIMGYSCPGHPSPKCREVAASIESLTRDLSENDWLWITKQNLKYQFQNIN